MHHLSDRVVKYSSVKNQGRPKKRYSGTGLKEAGKVRGSNNRKEEDEGITSSRISTVVGLYGFEEEALILVLHYLWTTVAKNSFSNNINKNKY